MKDAIGGTVSLMFIAVFLLFVGGYLAFSVSYNKAFRVKNKIITLLEQHGTFESASSDIDNYIKQVGYNAAEPNVNCEYYPSGVKYACKSGYCVAWVDTTDDTSTDEDNTNSGYFKVVTAVNIDVPIINKVMPYLRIFFVSGDTITIYDEENADVGLNDVCN